MMLTSVGMRRICIGPWQGSIWANSLKISWAKDATTGSKRIIEKKKNLHIIHFVKKKDKTALRTPPPPHQKQKLRRIKIRLTLPLLYLRKMAIVRGQILFSALVVKAGSTVQTMQRVSITKVRTSELNWVASCTNPSKILGRYGCKTCVLSDNFSWSQYLWYEIKKI